MAKLSDLPRIMKKYGDAVVKNTNAETIKLASIVNQTVITATPVDTGRAKGNWFATLGIPRLFSDYDSKDQAGSNQISKNDSVISNKTEGQSVYITNNLPYIKRLNDGYSAQAPAGYVEAAVRAANAAAGQIRILK